MQDEFKPKIYQFKKEGEIEIAKEELWKWEAEYNDGSVLRQFDDNTDQFHSMHEIDTTKLKALRIISSFFPHGYLLLFPETPFTLFIKHFRRTLAVGTKQEQSFTFFVFGYEKHYLVVCGDEAVITEDFERVISV